MTAALKATDVTRRLEKAVPGSVERATERDIWVKKEALLEVARYLKTSDLALDYLVAVTAVDYVDYFELVYHLVSIGKNQGLVLKSRVRGRDGVTVPSLTPLWQGAELQEREVYDLMGIYFEGHPNLKRIFLWEGFPGHPLRRDFLGSEPFQVGQ